MPPYPDRAPSFSPKPERVGNCFRCGKTVYSNQAYELLSSGQLDCLCGLPSHDAYKNPMRVI